VSNHEKFTSTEAITFEFVQLLLDNKQQNVFPFGLQFSQLSLAHKYQRSRLGAFLAKFDYERHKQVECKSGEGFIVRNDAQ
jgi:hypothetical protein